MSVDMRRIIGVPYYPKSAYIAGFDAACLMGVSWDRWKDTDTRMDCPTKYKEGTKDWSDWHEGYHDGLEEYEEYKDEIVRADPPPHVFEKPSIEADEMEDDDE